MNTAKKILILEDEAIISDLLAKKFSSQGYLVEVAQNGKQGIEMMTLETPDLVLTEVVMPEKDGFAVIEAMKQNKRLQDIPIIIISNSGQPVEIDRAKKLGVVDWVTKTEFDPNEILQKVKNKIG